MMKKMNVKLSPVSFIKYYETIEESQSSSNHFISSNPNSSNADRVATALQAHPNSQSQANQSSSSIWPINRKNASPIVKPSAKNLTSSNNHQTSQRGNTQKSKRPNRVLKNTNISQAGLPKTPSHPSPPKDKGPSQFESIFNWNGLV